eukprot:2194851-Rhodomonas_salina.3
MTKQSLLRSYGVSRTDAGGIPDAYVPGTKLRDAVLPGVMPIKGEEGKIDEVLKHSFAFDLAALVLTWHVLLPGPREQLGHDLALREEFPVLAWAAIRCAMHRTDLTVVCCVTRIGLDSGMLRAVRTSSVPTYASVPDSTRSTDIQYPTALAVLTFSTAQAGRG